MIWFCSRLIRPSVASSRKFDLADSEVAWSPSDVASRWMSLVLCLISLLGLAPGGLERDVVGDQPADADQALAGHGEEVAGPADLLDDGAKVLRRLAHAADLGAEDARRNSVHFGPGILERVGDTVDDRFQEAEHDLLAARALRAVGSLGAVGKDRERLRLGVADGHEARAFQDERHGVLIGSPSRLARAVIVMNSAPSS